MKEIGVLQNLAASLTTSLAQIVDSVDYDCWVQGGGLQGVEVEIIFDFMCPGSRNALTNIPTDDEEKSTDIFTMLE